MSKIIYGKIGGKVVGCFYFLIGLSDNSNCILVVLK